MRKSNFTIGVITHNYPAFPKDRQNAGIFVYDMVQELAKDRQVVVYCPGDQTRIITIGKSKVHQFKLLGRSKLGTLRLWNPFDLFILVNFFIQGYRGLNTFYGNNKNLDIVVAMWSFPAGLFAYLLNYKKGVPYLTWSLGSDIYVYAKWPIVKQIITEILRQARWRFADGIDLAQQVKQLSGKKCEFLPSASSFVSRKVKTHRKNKKIILTFVGRMEKVKGPDIFLSALIKIKNIISEFEINFVGDGSLLQIIKDSVNKEGLSQHVKFYGNVDDKNKIANILYNSSWLIIPSRSDSIPLVFSEGMKNGVPVVASALPDMRYLIDKYKIGIYFQPGNVNKLSKIIVNLPLKRKQRELFSKNTTEAAKIFSISRSAQKLLKIVYE